MNKYHARRTEVDGISFASKREARRYCDLRLLEKAGEIVDLELQPAFVLSCGGVPMLTPTGRKMIYKADFRYRKISTYNNVVVVEDSKGHDTRDSRTRRAVVLAEHGADVVLA